MTREQESFRDQLLRVQAMANSDEDTWDLSTNDCAAIKSVLADRQRMAEDLNRFRQTVSAPATAGLPMVEKMIPERDVKLVEQDCDEWRRQAAAQYAEREALEQSLATLDEMLGSSQRARQDLSVQLADTESQLIDTRRAQPVREAAAFIAGWGFGFQEALLPDLHPEEDRCSVAYDEWRNMLRDERAKA